MFEGMGLCITSVHKVQRKPCVCVNTNRNHYALSFRLSGEATLFYGTACEKVSGGSLSYIPAHLDYRLETGGEELIILHLDVWEYQTEKIEIFTPADPSAYASLFEEILSVWEGREHGFKHKCTSLLFNIFANIEKEQKEAEDSVNMPLNFRRALEHLHRHFTDNELSVSGLADLANVSEVYFRRIFFKNYKVTPLRYINGLRVEYAKELIQSKYYTVNQCAEMSGFSDVKYFSTVFKKYTGVPPSKY